MFFERAFDVDSAYSCRQLRTFGGLRYVGVLLQRFCGREHNFWLRFFSGGLIEVFTACATDFNAHFLCQR